MTRPRFTFCVPNLNKIKYLPACIDSILQQDCPDWRCVFVDGYSTDGSWEYMQQFKGDPRFLLLQGRQQGMYQDWNECLAHVDTEYFYILTSDDTCYPALVSETTRALDAHPDVDMCHVQFAYIDEQGHITRPYQDIIEHQFPLYAEVNRSPHRRSGLCEFVLHFAYRAPYVTITSLVFRTRLLETLQGFSSDYGSSGDYDWTMRAALATDVLYLPQLLATWRIYDGQATQPTRTVEKAERGLKIAAANVERLQTLKPKALETAQGKALLAHLSYEYLLRQYKQSRRDRRRLESAWRLARLVLHSPTIYLNHLQAKLTPKRTFTLHQSRTRFASALIRQYGLQWPPQQVALPAKP